MTNKEYASVLRRIADIYDTHADINQPFDAKTGFDTIYCHSKGELAAVVKAFGKGTKADDDNGVVFWPDCVKPLRLRVFGFKSDCCQRVVKGEEEVPEVRLPACGAQVIPAHRREIVEWVCAPFLDGGDNAQD